MKHAIQLSGRNTQQWPESTLWKKTSGKKTRWRLKKDRQGTVGIYVNDTWLYDELCGGEEGE